MSNLTPREIHNALTVVADMIDDMDEPPAYVVLSVQMGRDRTEDVDHLLPAGRAEPREMPGNVWHHTGDWGEGQLRITAYCPISEPPAARRERLVRELAALDAQLTGQEVQS